MHLNMLLNERKYYWFLFSIVWILFSDSVVAVESYEKGGDKQNGQEFIALKTGISGWRYDGECLGEVAGGSYKLTFYSPPVHKDVGGYGILTTMYNSTEKVYSGYEYYPYAGGEGVCGFIQVHDGGDLLVLDTENWAHSKRYVVSVDVKNSETNAFTYSLKDGNVYRMGLKDGSYLIAGFGLCPVGNHSDWVADMFCKTVAVDAYKKAKITLRDAIGMSLEPRITAGGVGAFKYYVLSSGQKNMIGNWLMKRFQNIWILCL